MTTVVYLHGFRSTPHSKKGQIMRQAWSDRYSFRAPDLNVSPEEAQHVMLETVKDLEPNETILVGSSLGGFYAHWLAQRTGCRAVLLNPATEPWTVINDYLGVQTIFGTDRTIEVLPSFADQTKAMVSQVTDPKQYFVLLCTGDEVLDWRKAQKKYEACQQLVVEGNTHEILDFENYLTILDRFVQER